MSETYYSGYDSDRGRKPRRSLLRRLLDLLMTLLTAVTAVTMVVTFFVPYVDPGRVWFFPVLGLAAPAVYVVTVVLALYWIIRWRLVRAGIMVALVIVGLFKVSLFYRPEFRRNYGDERYDRRAFKVMTYNVRGFYGENGLSSVGDVLQLIGDHNPDIICLQEFNARLAGQSDEFALLDEKYESAVFGRTQAPDSLYGAPLVILILVVLTAVSVRITGFNFSVLVKKGSKFFDILKAMFPPNTAYLGKIWQPLWDTIKMSFLGSFIGAVLAIPFAIAAASNIVTNRVVVFLVRLFLSLVRTLPTLVCALIATYIFGLGTMAGTCAIAVFTFAYVGKQLFEIIETVDMGPYEALEALGATRLRAFVTAVFPQVLPTYLSVSLFCLEGNVRYASILGYVGAGGLGLIMNEKIGWREYDSLGMILIVLFITVMIIEGVSHALRKRLT